MAPSSGSRVRAAALALAVALSGFVGTADVAAEADAAAVRRPNVLVLITDDQRVGTTGRQRALQRWFGTGGTEYTNAFATTPTCCPSRASIMTGRYAHNHGVLTAEGEGVDALDHRTTIQHYLDAAGYRTGLFGKFLNEWDVADDPPAFDDWAFYSTNRPSKLYRGNTWNVQGTLRRVDAYATTYVSRHALDFLSSAADGDRPWLMYVNTVAPHAPFVPEGRYARAPVPPFRRTRAVRERDRSDKPPYVRATRTPRAVAKAHRRGQLRTLMSVDDIVGDLFRALKRSGELTDTVAFYVSDNGYMWGEHGLMGKTAPYAMSVRVPLFIRWPGVVARRATDDRLVANVDIAPTVLEAAGVPPDPDVPMDGRPLTNNHARDRLLLEYWARTGRDTPTWAATITARSLYVEYFEPGGRYRLPFREYYDLRADEFELRNLLGDRTATNDAVPAHVSARLAADRACSGTEGARACP